VDRQLSAPTDGEARVPLEADSSLTDQSPKPAVEAQYVPDPFIDGRLMVLRHDGQLLPPVPGSNRE